MGAPQKGEPISRGGPLKKSVSINNTMNGLLSTTAHPTLPKSSPHLPLPQPHLS